MGGLQDPTSDQDNPFTRDPQKRIRLAFCDVHFFSEGCVRTIFPDGKHYEGWPHDSKDYREIAYRCGYAIGTTLKIATDQYCQEHEFCHNFLSERINKNVSKVLWPLAHGAPVNAWLGVTEESLVITFQRWLRADERPIIDRVDWDLLKTDALELLDG